MASVLISLEEYQELKDEIERLREALKSISKIPNSESAYSIIQTFVIDALNEKEKSNDGQPTEQEEWRDFDPDC
jgi:hypothetical protein